MEMELIFGVLIFFFILFYVVYKGIKFFRKCETRFRVFICLKCGSPQIINGKYEASGPFITTCEDCGDYGSGITEFFSEEEFGEFMIEFKE